MDLRNGPAYRSGRSASASLLACRCFPLRPFGSTFRAAATNSSKSSGVGSLCSGLSLTGLSLRTCSRGADRVPRANHLGRVRRQSLLRAEDADGVLMSGNMSPATRYPLSRRGHLRQRPRPRRRRWPVGRTLRPLRHRTPVFADGGYAGKLVEAARWFCGITFDIVKKTEGQLGFEVPPRRGPWSNAPSRGSQSAANTPPRPRLRAAHRHFRGHGQVGDGRRHGLSPRPVGVPALGRRIGR